MCEIRTFATPCWVWTGRRNRNGYGRLWCPETKRELMLHRYTWLMAGRPPIPRGYVLDHLCRVRACCNPAHLECVSVAENTRRGEAVLFGVKDPNFGSLTGPENLSGI